MAVLFPGDFAGVSDNGINFLIQLVNDLAQTKAALNQLIADHNSHTHGGVSTGAGTSSAPTASSAATVTVTETSDSSLDAPPTT